MNFGEKLTKLIEASGKTRQKIADDLGFRSKSNVTYYERSSSMPKTDILLKFCEYFDVSTEYFNSSAVKLVRQPQKEYDAEELKIPIMSNESADATQISYMVIPHSGITDGFAIVAGDDRLESIGISCGSTVILTRKINLLKKHKVIVKQNGEQFFATYEKLSENHAVIIPADREKTLIVLDGNQDNDAEIIAVVKSVICNE